MTSRWTEDLLGHGTGDGVLVLSVRGGQDLRTRSSSFALDEVDDIEETTEIAILGVLADRDESDRDTSSDTNGVLNIEVLKGTSLKSIRDQTRDRNTHGFNTGIVPSLGVRSAIESLESESSRRGDISTELGQEGLQISSLGELVDETRDAELDGGRGSLGGGDAVDSLDASRGDGGGARGGDGTSLEVLLLKGVELSLANGSGKTGNTTEGVGEAGNLIRTAKNEVQKVILT